MTARPRIVVSRCLGFEACRYDGGIIEAEFVDRLAGHASVETVCPEVELGLGVPRDPIRLVRGSDGPRLLAPSTDQDLTEAMQRVVAATDFSDVDGFILKSKSPSCGIADAKVHPDALSEDVLGYAAGRFASGMQANYPNALFIDETLLSRHVERTQFLSGIFTLARLRQLMTTPDMGGLVQFHADHKYLLLATNEVQYRKLGFLVANHERLELADVLSRYRQEMARAFQTEPQPRARRNALQHCFGYVSDQVSRSEREAFLGLLETSVDEATAQMRAWIEQYEVEYLAAQFYFRPYPEALELD